MEENVNLYPPKTNFFKQMEAFFRYDDDVKVSYDIEKAEIKVMVRGRAKAEALSKLLVPEKTFGNETVTVKVYPANVEETPETLFRDALTGNEMVRGIIKSGDVSRLYGSLHIMFDCTVAQYANDDISDLNGIHSTLYQYLAKKIFREQDGVFFNTDPRYI